MSMVMCMRTTINLPDALAEAVKRKADAEGRTFTSVVEEGLRRALLADPGEVAATVLPAYGDPDKSFVIDLLDRDAVWEALDEDRPR